MARFVYISPQQSDLALANSLGLGLIVVPGSTPHALIEGAGQSVNLPAPVTAQQVASAAAPILAAEQAANDAAAAALTNGQTLQSRAQAALTANATFLGLGSPTNPQVLAQVQTLTKECSALIRLALGLLDSTAGT